LVCSIDLVGIFYIWPVRVIPISLLKRHRSILSLLLMSHLVTHKYISINLLRSVEVLSSCHSCHIDNILIIISCSSARFLMPPAVMLSCPCSLESLHSLTKKTTYCIPSSEDAASICLGSNLSSCSLISTLLTFCAILGIIKWSMIDRHIDAGSFVDFTDSELLGFVEFSNKQTQLMLVRFQLFDEVIHFCSLILLYFLCTKLA